MVVTSLFFDRGYFSKLKVPGFSKYISMACFPYWAEYYLIDFAFFNTMFDNSFNLKRFAVSEKESRKNISAIAGRWESSRLEYINCEYNIDILTDFLQNLSTDAVILYDINFAGAVSRQEQSKLLEIFFNTQAQPDLSKISINNVPVDMYIAEKNRLIEIIKENTGFFPSEGNHIDVLFDDVLVRSFDRIIEAAGEIFFNNSIMQIYDNTMSLIDNRGNEKLLADFITEAPYPVEKDSIIGKKSKVVNSIISSNVKIEGYVENSVIFSDVSVKSNSKIINSVIFNGNQIGRDVIINNTLIFPNLRNTGNISNIQDKSEIGGVSKKGVNTNYPDQINNGLTFLGMNSSIPKGFSAEPGSMIGADVPIAKLKQAGKVSRNCTIT